MSPRYLTKSKFQLAMECPTKLYYDEKPQYSNLKIEDSFLQALAEGGYQIAALAKAYYKDGIEIKALDNEQALEETAKLLEQDSVILFEAAISPYIGPTLESDVGGFHRNLSEVD
jgi:hypothetical protein